jgi:hypothetical protein
MLLSSKPKPLCDRAAPRVCPVCRQTSYSASGIHPQCAMRQADAERMEKLKDAAPATPTVRKPAPWQRICPSCRAVTHVRTKSCACGHVFATAGPSTARRTARS